MEFFLQNNTIYKLQNGNTTDVLCRRVWYLILFCFNFCLYLREKMNEMNLSLTFVIVSHLKLKIRENDGRCKELAFMANCVHFFSEVRSSLYVQRVKLIGQHAPSRSLKSCGYAAQPILSMQSILTYLHGLFSMSFFWFFCQPLLFASGLVA